MTPAFKVKLSVSMILDFGLCFAVEKGCKFLFADLEPAELVTRGRERREKRRALEEKEKALSIGEKKTQ
jgi:cation-transporting ATPase 13A1